MSSVDLFAPRNVLFIPDFDFGDGGESADKLFSFFLFIKDRVIGKKSNGSPFSFDLNTFVFIRDNIRMQEASSFLMYMGRRVRVLGELEDDEFKRLLKCIYKSNHIKLKIKKEFDKHSIVN